MNEYFSLMMTFVRDAGEIALGLINESHPGLKADTSVITEADKRISALVHERLAPLLATGQHLLIEEEDPRRAEYLDQALLEKTPYLWSVDPVDGTRAYANRMPQYGISIGLLKDRRPWMGAVYFPSLKELFICDGKDAWYVQEAFTSKEHRTRIVPVDEDITSRSVFIATDEILSLFRWRQEACRVMIFATAVCEFCWPAIGRGVGSLSRVHLWDMAGSWPIFERAGLKMHSFDTGVPLEEISADLFEKEGAAWRLKGYYILSSLRNYSPLRSLLQQ